MSDELGHGKGGGINENIRYKISQYLDINIPRGKWELYAASMDRDGIPNRKQLIGMLLILCQHIENLEEAITSLK